MGAWALSFLLVGLVLAPLVVKAAGVTNYSRLTATDKSFLVLANQVAETVVGIAVIKRTIGGFDPLPEEADLFKTSWREPFSKPRGWLTWALLGMVLSPAVIGITVTIVSYAGYEAVGGQGTADGVARIISLDLPTYASLLAVTGILAPFLEETVFRGFLLTTLTKWMPTPAAVVLSATAFGLAHLSPRDLPQLIALGTLLGFSYVRSRNLLTPMIIHGAWNSVVLTVLFALTASGVNVSEMLSSGS
ncbi:Abi-domain-containing protein [Coccomyxa subellipsoidea C-169]|uniref:Abi-domain-containing protein n=1 Tax=Coccomyxa subellipsoidea (strain C-169) TaxID=574566 RepID=I0Z9S1_COCSC|nr:Abi-domain-containing protein [Coccomyxa subellipsoidea C-169]EIE27390.1 Abi-domain-containing protein [Coccomyxa subellipsoidea C-169]|eukprot:XP_005651934.1 Abi-domain-containing protein [Coccomyxa subellipsoidea C-169]